MAKALLCDLCGNMFPQTTSESTTGKWHRVNRVAKGRFIYIVYGVFAAPPAMASIHTRLVSGEDARNGPPLDVCRACTLELLNTKEEEVSIDDCLPEPGPKEP